MEFISLTEIIETLTVWPGGGEKQINESIHSTGDDRPSVSTQLNITQVELVISTSAIPEAMNGTNATTILLFSYAIAKKYFTYCAFLGLKDKTYDSF